MNEYDDMEEAINSAYPDKKSKLNYYKKSLKQIEIELNRIKLHLKSDEKYTKTILENGEIMFGVRKIGKPIKCNYMEEAKNLLDKDFEDMDKRKVSDFAEEYFIHLEEVKELKNKIKKLS